MDETFDIHIKFTSGDSTVEANKNITHVHSAIQRLHTGPAAAMGMIAEVKVVDIQDCTVFLSQNGKVIFPKR